MAKTAVEQRVDDYEDLQASVLSRQKIVNENIYYLEELKLKYQTIAEEMSAENSAWILERFRQKTEYVYEAFEEMYDEIYSAKEAMDEKVTQVGTQLTYYRGREAYEDTQEEELTAAEFNYPY